MRDNKNYAIYCRVGTYEQARGRGTKVVCYARSTMKNQIEKQMQDLKEYCKEKGYEVLDVKKDKCSGKRKFRFGLRRALKNKNAEAIVVKSMNVISRVPKVATFLITLIYGKKKFLIAADMDKVVNP